MSMMKNSSLLTGFLLFAILNFFSPHASAQGRAKKPNISSDEVLEFTLNDLKTQLQAVVAENAKLSRRNNALRKRMLSFQQDMRELGNHRLNLLEQNSDLKDFIKLEARENAVMKKKMREMEEEGSFSDEVRATLSKTVERAQERHQKLQNALAQVTANLEELRGTRADKRAMAMGTIEEKKDKMLELIQQTGASNRAMQKKLPEVRGKLADLKARQQKVLVRRADLEAQVDSMQSEIQKAEVKGESISGKTRKKVESTDELTGELKARINDLNDLYARLNELKGDFLDAHEKVNEDMSSQRLEVKNITELLTKERQLLAKQKDLLSARLNWEGMTSAEGRETIEERIRELSKGLEPLKAENQELKNKITEQGRQNQDLKKQEVALKAELIQLGDDIRKVQNKGQQSIEETLKERKNHLKKLLNSYQAKNESIKKQIAAHREKSAQSRERIASWGNRQEEFQLALKTAQDDLQKAREQEGVIRQESKDMEGRQSQGAERLKDEIATLELRKSVLITSLTAIKNKYSQDKITIKEFVHSDQKELQQYLTVLKTENSALKERLAGLWQTIQGLGHL